MKRSWKATGLVFAALVGMAIIVPAVLAATNRQIVLKPTSAYPAAEGVAQF